MGDGRLEEWSSNGVLGGLLGVVLGEVLSGGLSGGRGGVTDGRSELACASRIPYPMHRLATAPCYRPPPPSLTPYAGRSQLLFTATAHSYCPQLLFTATAHRLLPTAIAHSYCSHLPPLLSSCLLLKPLWRHEESAIPEAGGDGVDGMHGFESGGVGWMGRDEMWDGIRCGIGLAGLR